MNRFYFVFLLAASLVLSSCFSKSGFDPDDPDEFLKSVYSKLDLDKKDKGLTQKDRELLANRCVAHPFSQREDSYLYGRGCVEDRYLVIQSQEGQKIATSESINPEEETADALKLEGKLSFINEVYRTAYKILKGQGSDVDIPFLTDFLPENEKFFGSQNATYRIVFETEGNYLILYKSSTRLEDIPYTERTSMKEVVKDGVTHYMVPFLGYPFKYCNALFNQNQQKEDLNTTYQECGDVKKENATYLKIILADKEIYRYAPNKKDFFPSNYFLEGEWFFTDAPIETDSREEQISPIYAYLIKFKKASNYLEIVDASGDIPDEKRRSIKRIFVDWLNYEMNKDGDIFRRFGERLSISEDDKTKSPYLRINFKRYNTEILEFLVSEDYFSITSKPSSGQRIKYKMSFYRKSAVDESTFVQRRRFGDDHRSYFGILATKPQEIIKLGDLNEDELSKRVRMIRFDTSREKTVLKWYFSKNSTPEEFYRNMVREAIHIYNRAFEIIADGKVIVDLIEEEEVLDEESGEIKLEKADKDLGDMRYNLVNLVKSEDVSGEGYLFGIGPPYVNPNTGQTIGVTANIFVHNVLDEATKNIRNYIRYEIFQERTAKKTQQENISHAVSPYVRSEIQSKCSEVEEHIDEQRAKFLKGEIDPTTNIKERDKLLSCVEKISKDHILSLILHEMGHNFGLGHNFKASVDEKAYYQSIEEIEGYFPNVNLESFQGKVPKSSSVMDYLPILKVPPLTVLGKYDLAALKYLYMDQFEYVEFEEKDGIETRVTKTIALEIPEDPFQQKQLEHQLVQQLDNPQLVQEILDKKTYLYCPDSIEIEDDPFCMREDYGSNPAEIVQFYAQEFNNDFNRVRYRYDSPSPPEIVGIFLGMEQASIIHGIENFYSIWIELRDQYLLQSHKMEYAQCVISEDKSSIDEYQRLLQVGLGQGEEYDNYHAMRDSANKFFTDFMFLETMKCEVCRAENLADSSYKVEEVQCENEEQRRFIDLELIRQELPSAYKEQKGLYIKDCHSDIVKHFLWQEGLAVSGQKGLENFKSESYNPDPRRENKKWDIIPVSKFLGLQGLLATQTINRFFSFTQEPDFFEEFRVKLEDQILQDYLSEDDLQKLLAFYEKYFEKVTDWKEGDSREILRSNVDHLTAIVYSTGVGSGSFYQTVVKPVEDGYSIEDIEHPFLLEEYNKWKSSAGDDEGLKEFQEYFVNLPTTLDDRTAGSSIIAPFRSGNFVSEMILKYNDNLKEIERLESLEEQRFEALGEEEARELRERGETTLTFLEKTDKNSRAYHNKRILLRMIMLVRR